MVLFLDNCRNFEFVYFLNEQTRSTRHGEPELFRAFGITLINAIK